MTQRLHRIFIPRSWRGGSARLLVLLLVAVFGWYGTGLYYNIVRVTADSNPLQLVSALLPTTLKTTNGRTNILLAGYSADDSGHAGAYLTDSIMMVSINQADKSAVVVSIPRDLYVNIPGYGYSKINAAYEYGEASNFSEAGYASGGMGLLEKTVAQVTGFGSNYYALINYAAFKDAVDAVGGVSLTVASSDARGLYDPNTNLQLANGTVALDGQTALNLARSRGDGYGSYGFANGDFSRTEYQQQLLVALKQKVASSSVALNPLKVSQLASSLGKNVKTDLQLREIVSLYSATKGLSDSQIKRYTLNNFNDANLLSYYTTTDYQSALIPASGLGDYAIIQSSISQALQ
jgi:LCP family protein required for cell wall assembly